MEIVPWFVKSIYEQYIWPYSFIYLYINLSPRCRILTAKIWPPFANLSPLWPKPEAMSIFDTSAHRHIGHTVVLSFHKPLSVNRLREEDYFFMRSLSLNYKEVQMHSSQCEWV